MESRNIQAMNIAQATILFCFADGLLHIFLCPASATRHGKFSTFSAWIPSPEKKCNPLWCSKERRWGSWKGKSAIAKVLQEERRLRYGKTWLYHGQLRDHYLVPLLKAQQRNIQCGNAESQFWQVLINKLVQLLVKFRGFFLVYWSYFYCMCLEWRWPALYCCQHFLFYFLPFLWETDISKQFCPG